MPRSGLRYRGTSGSDGPLSRSPPFSNLSFQFPSIKQFAAGSHVGVRNLTELPPQLRHFGMRLRRIPVALGRSLFCCFRHDSIVSSYNWHMIHAILPVGMLQCNCSILGDESSREAIVVDPGDNIDQILLILAQHELRVKAIVITHAHIDHIGGAQKLKASTGAPVYMNEDDAPLYDTLEMQAGWLGVPTPERTEIDSPLRDGDTLHLGPAELHALHTPGH